MEILENQAPNCGITKLEDSDNTRLGRRLIVPKVNGGSQTNQLKEQAFQINGVKLFNCLPSSLRNQSVYQDKFKEKLDQYLAKVPDQPRIDGLSPGVETNSILFQTKRGQGGSCSTPGPRESPCEWKQSFDSCAIFTHRLHTKQTNNTHCTLYTKH